MLNVEQMKADGYTDAEIKQIDDYLCDAEKRGRLDRRPVVLYPAGAEEPELVCKSYAKILVKVRPGSVYQDIPRHILDVLARHKFRG